MGKIMSVLEKYKLIEKEGEPMSLLAEEEKESFPYEETSRTEETSRIEEAFRIEAAAEEPKEEKEQVIEIDLEESIPEKEHTVERGYNKTLTLDEIYNMYNLGGIAVTNTVFVLEGFINALPAELPEYVKKTTVDNILTASAMDLQKLMDDGNKRSNYLKSFMNDYETQTTQDIDEMKEEIDKLSAIISEYQQQIKYKEMLLQEQSTLVKNEANRLDNIFEFFNK